MSQHEHLSLSSGTSSVRCSIVDTPTLFFFVFRALSFRMYRGFLSFLVDFPFSNFLSPSFILLCPIYISLTFVCTCIVSIISVDDQQDAAILVYLFIPNQLYMFRAMFSPIIRSNLLYVQLLILSTDVAAGWYHG